MELFKNIPVLNAEKIKNLGLFIIVKEGKIQLEEDT